MAKDFHGTVASTFSGSHFINSQMWFVSQTKYFKCTLSKSSNMMSLVVRIRELDVRSKECRVEEIPRWNQSFQVFLDVLTLDSTQSSIPRIHRMNLQYESIIKYRVQLYWAKHASRQGTQPLFLMTEYTMLFFLRKAIHNHDSWYFLIFHSLEWLNMLGKKDHPLQKLFTGHRIASSTMWMIVETTHKCITPKTTTAACIQKLRMICKEQGEGEKKEFQKRSKDWDLLIS